MRLEVFFTILSLENHIDFNEEKRMFGSFFFSNNNQSEIPHWEWSLLLRETLIKYFFF